MNVMMEYIVGLILHQTQVKFCNYNLID